MDVVEDMNSKFGVKYDGWHKPSETNNLCPGGPNWQFDPFGRD